MVVVKCVKQQYACEPLLIRTSENNVNRLCLNAAFLVYIVYIIFDLQFI